MSSADLEAVAALDKAASILAWPPKLFADCLREDYLNLCLWAEGQVEGFSLCSFGAGEAHLQNIVVNAQQQGQGWGRWLLQQTLLQLKSRAIKRLYLEVRASNLPAIQLYQSIGFENIGLRRDYYQAPVGREDAYVYMLELS